MCCGDSTDISVRNGTPYFILKAANEEGIQLSGIKLFPNKLNIIKPIWNIKQLLFTGRYSGFQYSNTFFKKLFKQSNLPLNENLNLISQCPFLPIYPWNNNWNVYFYIDATTKQIFEEYRYISISDKYKIEILEKEKKNYLNAKLIFCMSNWAKDSLLKDYDISESKIKIWNGGSNLSSSFRNTIKKKRLPLKPSQTNPLKIGFIGKEWERKGGPFLLKLIEKLNSNGIYSVLKVVGPINLKLPKNNNIELLGFIDKRKDQMKFTSEVQSWHYSTLFSKSEAYGISNKECLQIGVPVICHDVGGIKETIPDKICGKVFKKGETVDFVAKWIGDQISNYEIYLKQRKQLLQRSNEFRWNSTINEVFKLISIYDK